MNPGCWCRSHDLEGRTIYDMHEIDPEQNEVSASLAHRGCSFSTPADNGKTALQVYAASYKSLPLHDDTFALLRKARRLDTALAKTPKAVDQKACASCGIDVSPLWHVDRMTVKTDEDRMDIDGEEVKQMDITERRMCHLCWYRSKAAN